MKPLSPLLAGLLLLATPALSECRLALSLGLDVSGSVDGREYRLQLDGVAAALQAPELRAQVLALPAAPIWLSVFEWSGSDEQSVIINWRALQSQSDLDAISARLQNHTERRAHGSTAIGHAMLFAADLFAQRPNCQSYTLDLSGDGISNDGRFPQVVRREAPLSGITINGLVIGSDITTGRDERQMEMMALSAYFRTRVIRGPGAFIEVAQGFEDFERAMTRKLLRETKGILIGQN